MLRVVPQGLVALLALSAPLSGAASQKPPPSLRAIPELRIDAADEDLSPVGWIAVARSGVIAVGQPQDRLVRFFDSRGEALGTFGRDGAGPGEFRYLTIHGWIGDTLWVNDISAHRLTLIAPERTLVRTVPWPTSVSAAGEDSGRAPRFIFVVPWAIYPDGSLLAYASLATDSPRPEWMGPDRQGMPAIRVTRDGMLTRIVAWRESRDDCSVPVHMPGGRGSAGIPFCAQPLIDLARDGSRMAQATIVQPSRGPGSYRVTVVDARGDTTFSRSYPFTPVSITRKVADSVIAARAARAPGPAYAAAIRAMNVPPTYPPLRRILVGRDGTTWLELWTSSGDRTWHVLDGKGDVIGALMVPRRIDIKVGDLGTIWATDTDEDGLESVVRFRVRR